jgi:hypothetical protein
MRSQDLRCVYTIAYFAAILGVLFKYGDKNLNGCRTTINIGKLHSHAAIVAFVLVIKVSPYPLFVLWQALEQVYS